MNKNEQRVSILRRTAKEVRNYRVRMKILSTLLIMLVLVTAAVYVSSALYKNNGSFTVNLDKFQMTKYGLSLSEKPDISHPTSHLNAKIAEDITNIAGEQIPANVDQIDGEHNGENYIAYTFYLQNAGEVTVSYQYSVDMYNITQGLDDAIRLKLYVNGAPTTYAKTATDGSGPEPGTTPFYSATQMCVGRVETFNPGDVTKFTVVIWIEGNDPDCLDWLIGGHLQVDMNMEIIH